MAIIMLTIFHALTFSPLARELWDLILAYEYCGHHHVVTTLPDYLANKGRRRHRLRNNSVSR